VEKQVLLEGWELARIGDCVVEVTSGFACAKKHAVAEGLPHLRPFNVGMDGELTLSSLIHIPEDFMSGVERYYLDTGDVLFNNTNSVELVGKAAIVREPMRCAFSNHITRLRTDPARLLPGWLLLSLRQLWSDGFFAARCRKWIGQAGFNTGMLADVEIPLPLLDEQRRIVVRIEELFARIEEARRLRAAADQDAERLMSAALAEVFPNPEDELPKGWHLRHVAEISEKPQYGYTQSARDEPVGPKFLRITDIQDGQVNWKAVPFCLCAEKELEKYRLEPGDIVFARSGATTGKTFLIEECPEAVFASYLIRLKVRGVIEPAYVYWFFQSPYYWRQVKPRGAAQPNMNAKILSGLKVPIPGTPAEQHHIVEYLNGVQAQVVELKRLQAESAVELERLSGAVLARAFRGEL